MSAELEQVIEGMRAAGWRGTDEAVLRAAAAGKLLTAQGHDRQAHQWRESLQARSGRHAGATGQYLHEAALRHELRSASLRGTISRQVNNTALVLVPGWTGSLSDLIEVAEAILESASPAAGLKPRQPTHVRSSRARQA